MIQLIYRPLVLFAFSSFFIYTASFHAAANEDVNEKENAPLKQLLAPKEGEMASEESTKDIFSKTEENYSLLEKGEFSASLDADYSYYESDQQTAFLVGGRFSILDITTDSERVISTSVGLDYGITKNISIGFSLPFYVKNNEQEALTTTDIGDTQVSARWQPRPSVRGKTTSLLFLSVNINTGENPYKIDIGEEQSTGQGFPSLTFGSTFFKALDPLIGFGSFSYTYNADADGFNQLRTFFVDDTTRPGILTEIEPGDSLSATFGLSYAITYDFTLTLQYQHSIAARSTLIWRDSAFVEHQTKSATYDSGIAKLTTSWKGEEGKYLNLYFALPVTSGQPDIIVGFSIPLFP